MTNNSGKGPHVQTKKIAEGTGQKVEGGGGGGVAQSISKCGG